MMKENGMLLNTSKALLVGSLVWVGVTPLAQSELKTFQPGDVIKSSEINGNFEYLEGQIEDLDIGAVNSDLDNLKSRIGGIESTLDSTTKVVDCNADTLALDTALLQEAHYTANTHGIIKKFEINGECEVGPISIDGTSVTIVGGSDGATIAFREESDWNVRFNSWLGLENIVFKNSRIITSQGSTLSWGRITFDNPRGIFLVGHASLYAASPTSLSQESSSGALFIGAYRMSSVEIKNSEMRYQLHASTGSTMRCFDCIDVAFTNVIVRVNSNFEGSASDDQDLSIETLNVSLNSTFAQRGGSGLSGLCASTEIIADDSSVIAGITSCSE